MTPDKGSHDPVVTTVIQDPSADLDQHEHEQPHDHATEVAHAWDHFYENARFFACFLAVILLTVFAFNVNFGSSPLVLPVFGHHLNFGTWNFVAVLFLAALRSALIAYFLSTLFKNFSLVFRTLTFTAFFLAGMIFLSLWDSALPHIGDPISNRYDHVP